MPAPSPTCTVQDGGGAAQSTLNGANVTAGNTVTIALASAASVDTWQLSVVGTDDLVTTPTITLNAVTKTATYTAPAGANAMRFQTTVTNVASGQTVSATFGVFTVPASGIRLASAGETIESNATFGWAPKVNNLIRASLELNYTFPSDANQTLTSAQSAFGRIFIQPGVVTGIRTITSANAPVLGMAPIRIINRNSRSVAFQWSSGSALTVLGGTQMDIGSDGTNAVAHSSAPISVSADGTSQSIGSTVETHSVVTNASFGFIAHRHGSGYYIQGPGGANTYMSVFSAGIYCNNTVGGDPNNNSTFRWTPVSVAITDGADTVLTAAQYSAPKLTLTGALTAGRNAIVPSTDGSFFMVFNNTTGGFAVTVKVTGQTGVAVAAGKRAILYADGTDIRRVTPDT